MEETHAQNHAKQQACFAQLQSLGLIPKGKMFKFYRNVRLGWNELDKEYVNCRRMRKLTLKYTELTRAFEESVTVFEQYSLIAALTY